MKINFQTCGLKLGLLLFLCLFSSLGQCQIILNTSILECAGDSTLIKADQAEGFLGWTNLEDNSIGISTPNSITTWVNSDNLLQYKYSANIKNSNLIFNGDFQFGNKGFWSEYGNQLGFNTHNQFAIGKNPKNYSSFFVNKGDHTSGNGNMFIADGGRDFKKFYLTNLKVEANAEYILTFWCANIHKEFVKANPDTMDFSPASFEIRIDTNVIGTITLKPDTSWYNFTQTWKSYNTGDVKLSIRCRGSNTRGNDFALDDIHFYKLEKIKSPVITVYPCNDLQVFSPDGDGKFDTFFIENTGIAKIYNLAGKIINQINCPGYWDGSTLDGTLADSGYYAILINDKFLHVSLFR